MGVGLDLIFNGFVLLCFVFGGPGSVFEHMRRPSWHLPLRNLQESLRVSIIQHLQLMLNKQVNFEFPFPKPVQDTLKSQYKIENVFAPQRYIYIYFFFFPQKCLLHLKMFQIFLSKYIICSEKVKGYWFGWSQCWCNYIHYSVWKSK